MIIDGNIGQIEFGGQYGDAGYQLSHDGLVAAGNGQLRVQDVHLHHHGRDGIMLQDPNRLVDQPARPVALVDVHCDYNGRQGLSWVGGRGLRATRYSFSFSGRVSIPISIRRAWKSSLRPDRQGGVSSPPSWGRLSTG